MGNNNDDLKNFQTPNYSYKDLHHHLFTINYNHTVNHNEIVVCCCCISFCMFTGVGIYCLVRGDIRSSAKKVCNKNKGLI